MEIRGNNTMKNEAFSEKCPAYIYKAIQNLKLNENLRTGVQNLYRAF